MRHGLIGIRRSVVTAEELHFGRAAKRLGMSQPLELGSRLLDRDRRNVSLTAAGEIFLREARKVLSTLDQATLLTQPEIRAFPTKGDFMRPKIIGRSRNLQRPKASLECRRD
jgi:hypothetical protein